MITKRIMLDHIIVKHCNAVIWHKLGSPLLPCSIIYSLLLVLHHQKNVCLRFLDWHLRLCWCVLSHCLIFNHCWYCYHPLPIRPVNVPTCIPSPESCQNQQLSPAHATSTSSPKFHNTRPIPVAFSVHLPCFLILWVSAFWMGALMWRPKRSSNCCMQPSLLSMSFIIETGTSELT